MFKLIRNKEGVVGFNCEKCSAWNPAPPGKPGLVLESIGAPEGIVLSVHVQVVERCTRSVVLGELALISNLTSARTAEKLRDR